MDQLSLASLDFAARKKRTKRDVFLAEMATVVPWAVLEAVIEPHYPKTGPKAAGKATGTAAEKGTAPASKDSKAPSSSATTPSPQGPARQSNSTATANSSHPDSDRGWPGATVVE